LKELRLFKKPASPPLEKRQFKREFKRDGVPLHKLFPSPCKEGEYKRSVKEGQSPS